MAPSEDSEDSLRRLLAEADADDGARLIEVYREQMIRIVGFRMDGRLANRVDPGDVVQEAFVVAWKRIDEFLDQSVSLVVWLRFLVLQKLAEIHRSHFGVQARDATRDVRLIGVSGSSIAMSHQIVADATTPSEAAVREEQRLRVQQALEQLDERDREILTLRHLERLSNQETSEILEISPQAVSNRMVRALERLRAELIALGESQPLI